MNRKIWQKIVLASPLVAAGAFAGQIAIDYPTTGEVDLFHAFGVLLFLANFFVFLHIARKSEREFNERSE